MNNSCHKIKLLVAGSYIKSDAYQNVKYRIASLEKHPDVSIEEITCGYLTKNDRVQSNKAKLFICHIISFLKLIFKCNNKILYIPYPAVFFQFILSFLPNFIRPKLIVIDVFISLYDTAIIDRQLADSNSIKSKIIYYIEKRAFNSSDYIVVDTDMNQQYYAELFKISKNKFAPIPLATNEIDFQESEYTPDNTAQCRILFIGTLIPLHGIDTIIEAARILKENRQIHFHIIGDGQDSDYVKNYIKENPGNLSWNRNWHSSKELNQEISKSDICLGIFGSSQKTQRVCPYKIYHYARVGRAIITANTKWTSNIRGYDNAMPFMLTDVNNPDQLANRVLQLTQSVELRIKFAIKSKDYYVENFTVDSSTKKLLELTQ